jgi:hypothetical protein
VWLVADGEALALVLRFFQLVDQGDGVVFHGDFAVAQGIADEPVFAEAESSGALAGLKEGCWAEGCPIDVGFLN